MKCLGAKVNAAAPWCQNSSSIAGVRSPELEGRWTERNTAKGSFSQICFSIATDILLFCWFVLERLFPCCCNNQMTPWLQIGKSSVIRAVTIKK